MLLLNRSSVPRTRSSDGSSPPTIRVRVPLWAAAAPPEIPASRKLMRFAASSPPMRRVESGELVLRSTTIVPSRAAAMSPSSPNTTASTALLSGNESRTMSDSDMTVPGSGRARAPASMMLSACRSKPATGTPASTMRRAMRPPMLPSPTNPIRSSDTMPPVVMSIRTSIGPGPPCSMHRHHPMVGRCSRSSLRRRPRRSAL